MELDSTFLVLITANKTDSEKIKELQAQRAAATNTEGAHAEALMDRIAIFQTKTNFVPILRSPTQYLFSSILKKVHSVETVYRKLAK